MDRERKLAHIIAYYLSRFDKTGLQCLGFKNDKDAFHRTAESLGIPSNYIKFRRDEFDVVHPHRKGWHKRPMTPSIINTINALQDLDEPTLRGIVKDILSNSLDSDVSDDLDQIVLIFPDEKKKKRSYSPRNITGRKAEEIFVEWFKKGQHEFPIDKALVDMRDYGCGFDFQLVLSENKILAFEVKGVTREEGGLLITNKEWETASHMMDSYFLILVSNVNEEPSINIISNPIECLSPKRSIQTVIQVSWTVSQKEIQKLLKK